MKKLILVVAMAFVAVSVHAEIFTFDFRGSGGAYDFDAHTGQITTNGITMSFTAFDLEDPAAELNSVTYLGVNSNDDSDTDTVEIGQYITISFSSSLYDSIDLQTIAVGAWTSGDAGYYQIDSGSQVALTSGDNDLIPQSEVLGKALKFASTAGNGLGLNTITVEAVPEPATIAMFGIGGILSWIIRRSSRK